jgi:hypothetical protein
MIGMNSVGTCESFAGVVGAAGLSTGSGVASDLFTPIFIKRNTLIEMEKAEFSRSGASPISCKRSSFKDNY